MEWIRTRRREIILGGFFRTLELHLRCSLQWVPVPFGPVIPFLRLLRRYSKLRGVWKTENWVMATFWSNLFFFMNSCFLVPFPPNPSESRDLLQSGEVFNSSVSRSVMLTLCYPRTAAPRLLCPWVLQARLLEWVAIPFSRGSSSPRDRIQVSCMAGRFITIWATGKPWQSVWVPMSWRIWDSSKWARVLLSQGSVQNSRELTDEFLWFLNFLKILCKILNHVYFENSGVSFRSWKMSVTHPN